MTSDRSKSFRITKVQKREAARAAADANAPKPLPEFAKKADDLDAVRKAVDDAAAVSGTLWLSYIFTLFYLAVAAGAVTHVDLLLNRPVKLPFLNIDLPLLAFFSLAPILFVIAHVYTLSYFVLLGRKATNYHRALYDAFPSCAEKPELSEAEDQANADERDSRRRLLPSNIFVQFLAGPPEVRDAGFGRLLKFIAWATLVFGPILLLLLLQIQFLPYHSSPITWTQRIMLLADLVMLWWLWREILWGRSDLHRWGKPTTILKMAVASGASVAAFLISWSVATFPGEWLDEHQLLTSSIIPTRWAEPTATLGPILGSVAKAHLSPKSTPQNNPPKSQTTLLGPNPPPAAQESVRTYEKWCLTQNETDKPPTPPIDLTDWLASTCLASPHDALFAGRVDEATRRRTSPFSNTLVLPGFNIFEAQKIDEPTKVAWKKYTIDLRARHLDGAILTAATIPRTDFTGATLRRAMIDFSDLSYSNFEKSNLEEAHLQGSKADRSSFLESNLVGTRLDHGSYVGSTYIRARLIGTNCERSDFRLSSFAEARIQNASFIEAELKGTSFSSAEISVTRFERAQLQGSDMGAFSMKTLNFSDAILSGAHGAPRESSAILLENTHWTPVYRQHARDTTLIPWDRNATRGLKELIMEFPADENRSFLLSQINDLSCSASLLTKNSCNDKLLPEFTPIHFQKKITESRISEKDYDNSILDETAKGICNLGNNTEIRSALLNIFFYKNLEEINERLIKIGDCKQLENIKIELKNITDHFG